MAALREARRGGNGDHVDVSMFEVVAIMLTLYPYMFGALMGSRELTAVRMMETPGCEKTADGWIGFCCNSVEQAAAFWKLVGMPQLAEVPDLVSAAGRSLDRDGVLPLFEDELLARTTADLLSEAVASRIPAVPVGHAADLLTNEHLATRGAYVKSPHGFDQPRVPYTIGERRRRPPALAPAVGEHSDQPWSEPWDAPPAPGERRRPLEGIRVLDLTTWLAGPIAAHTFAGLGAEVIKVESCHRFDNMRLTATKRYSDDYWWEFAPLFHGVNAGKRDITLDLATEDGRRLARDLVQQCDVLIENGTPRVLDQFGLGWDVVHSLNDQTIVVRMPAFGLTGPWRDRPGFAQSMEQLSGMAMITGFPDGPPTNPRGPCDAIQAMQAAIATLAALDAREQTGVASMVEVTMVETILAIVAESQLEHQVHGVDLERMGNRGPYAAPQGVYPCRGEEKWLAVAVQTDAQWDGLRAALDLPDDPPWTTMAGRQSAHDDLDARIGAWAAGQDIEPAVAHLLSYGVPAASVESGYYLHRNEQLVDRGFFEEVEHAFAGRYGTPGLPFRLASVKRWFERAAPFAGPAQRRDPLESARSLSRGARTAARQWCDRRPHLRSLPLLTGWKPAGRIPVQSPRRRSIGDKRPAERSLAQPGDKKRQERRARRPQGARSTGKLPDHVGSEVRDRSTTPRRTSQHASRFSRTPFHADGHGLMALADLEAHARLHRRDQTDDPLSDAVALGDGLGQIFLVEAGAPPSLHVIERDHRPSRRGGQAPAVISDPGCGRLGVRHELFQADTLRPQAGPDSVLVEQPGQLPLENQPVVHGQTLR